MTTLSKIQKAVLESLDSILELRSIGLRIPLRQVYEGEAI